MEADCELYGGIDRLAAELETIAADAQHDRFIDLLRRSGLTADQLAAVVDSTAFGPLAASLRCAEAYHHDLEKLVPRVVGQHGLDDAEDVAAVIRYRIDQVAASSPRGCRRRPHLIVGLIPAPLGEMSAEERQSIDERAGLIGARALVLATEAVEAGAPWTCRLGTAPTEPKARETWLLAAATVAAYRDRYKVTSAVPVGGGAGDQAQLADRERARSALQEAVRVAAEDPGVSQRVSGPARAVTVAQTRL
jgi:hypothetical protein